MKTNYRLIGTGVLTAIVSSLCCITPVLALLAGTGGFASAFSWVEPIRPHLISFTIFVLGFAWYQKIFPKKDAAQQAECKCEGIPAAGNPAKTKFLQSKTFLGIMTVFAFLMVTFPSYSYIFFPKKEKQAMTTESSNVQRVVFAISGMSCSGCEEHIESKVSEVNGVIRADASYEQGNAAVEFDKSKTTIDSIEKTISSTGYTITGIQKR